MYARKTLYAAILLAATGGTTTALATETAADQNALAPGVAQSTVDEMRGALVENRDGVVIGKLADVVRSDDGELLAVVQPGEVDSEPGVGALVPLANFSRHEDHLRATTGHTVQSVASARERPAVAADPVPGDIHLRKLVEGGKLEALADETEPLQPFSDLDLDHDGVLTSSEAHASTAISDAWPKLDVNDDGVIDRSEASVLYDDMYEGAPPTAEEASR
jgi:hypothetical protein